VQSAGAQIGFSKRLPKWPDTGNDFGKTQRDYQNHFQFNDNQKIFRKCEKL
jgi:hypothetical protein